MKNLIQAFEVFGKDQIFPTFLDKDALVFDRSLSQILKHLEEDKPFGVISSFRHSDSLEENLKSYSKLKTTVSDTFRLGYIELIGGFKESGEWVNEKSLFIPNIKKEILRELGEKYLQYSVTYKDKSEFVEIGTADSFDKGTILSDFKKEGWHEKVSLNAELTKEVFSKWIKGSHRDREFLLNLNESFLMEVSPKSFNEAYAEDVKGVNQKKYIRLV